LNLLGNVAFINFIFSFSNPKPSPSTDGGQSTSVELRQTQGNQVTLRSRSDTGEHPQKLVKVRGSSEKLVKEENRPGKDEEEEEQEEEEEEEEETPLFGTSGLPDSRESTPGLSSPMSTAASRTPSVQDPELLVDLASSSSLPSLTAARKQGGGKLRRAATTTDGQKKRWEIPYTDLRFHRLLGKGSSGSVFLGTWGGEQVAIKKLICDASLLEADLLR